MKIQAKQVQVGMVLLGTVLDDGNFRPFNRPRTVKAIHPISEHDQGGRMVESKYGNETTLRTFRDEEMVEVQR